MIRRRVYDQLGIKVDAIRRGEREATCRVFCMWVNKSSYLLSVTNGDSYLFPQFRSSLYESYHLALAKKVWGKLKKGCLLRSFLVERSFIKAMFG